ncbi:MAG: hypothetical protein OXB93_07150 [Cytophagales bacterium]|nr:hypothetical protein [Cytophagales bacterium]
MLNLEAQSISHEEESISLLLRGYQYSLMGSETEAISLWRKSLEKDSQNDAAYCFIAKAYHRGQKYGSIYYIQEALRIQPENIHYHETKARFHEEFHEYEEAIMSYEECFRLSTMRGQKRRYLLQIEELQTRLKRTDDRIHTYCLLLETQPEQLETVFMKIVEAHAELDDDRKFKKNLLSLLETYPEERILHEIYLDHFVSKSKYRKYLRSVEHVFQPEDPISLEIELAYTTPEHLIPSLEIFLNREDLDFMKKEAWVQRQLRKKEEFSTKDRLIRVLCPLLQEAHPEELSSYFCGVEIYWEEGRYEELLKILKRPYELFPHEKEILIELIRTEEALKNYDTLILYTKKGRQLYPHVMDFYYYESIALFELGNHQPAISMIEEGLERDDLDTDHEFMFRDLYLHRADHLFAAGFLEIATEAYEEILSLFPDSDEVKHNYSYCLLERKVDLDSLESLWRESIQGSDSPAYLHTYARILYGQGRYKESLRWFEKALHSNFKNSTSLPMIMGRSAELGRIRETYGDALYQANQRKKALKVWKSAVQEKGTSPLLLKKIRDQRFYE